jgi:hypothetical protein
MTRLKILLLTVFLSLPVLAQTQEYYFRLPVQDRPEVDQLTRLFSVDKLEDAYVYGYAVSHELTLLEAMGYAIEKLPHPGSLYEHRMSESADQFIEDWDTYPTYDGYLDMMAQYADSFSAICRLDTFGYSVQGRLLLAMKITDNPGIEEDEPEFLYTSTMHGDETVGYVLSLRLIDYLLHQYGQATPEGQRATALVNKMEIWINPLFNPDGTYWGGNHTVTGAIRRNAHFVDLNRDFPDRINDPNNTTTGREPETAAMMLFVAAHNFNLSANFHGGAQVVNYPWDNGAPSGVYSASPDDAWFIELSESYSLPNPDMLNGGFPNGISNGCQWYAIFGGRQDWIYWWHGGRETTVELWDTKNPPGSILPQRWENNKESLLAYMEQALPGIRGIVSDAISGQALAAQIDITGFPDVPVFTDPEAGDYHRLLLPGSYDAVVSAEDYQTDTLFNVTVPDTGATRLDVVLTPLNPPAVFTPIAASFTALKASSAAWGDYDRDGDLDLLMLGTPDPGAATKLYRNDGADQFTEINTNFPGLAGGSLAWGDFNNDGCLDILISGHDGFESRTYLFQNNGDDTFSDMNAGLIGLSAGSVAWGDYDNDGDADILLSGFEYLDGNLKPLLHSKIYRNDGPISDNSWNFTDIEAELAARYRGFALWLDYDNDSDLDILLGGADTSDTPLTQLYRNDGEALFSAETTALPGVMDGSAASGDFDNDGDADIFLCGIDSAGLTVSVIFRNTGEGNFEDINAGIIGLSESSAARGDSDNDGDPDLLLTGKDPSGLYRSLLYRNDGGGMFSEMSSGLTNVAAGTAVWGDYDNDEDLDIFLSGASSDTTLVSTMYRNHSLYSNTPPTAPNGLSTAVNESSVTLSWLPAADAETPSAGLSYNLRVGTMPGGIDMVSPLAEISTGQRLIPAIGNAQQDTVWTIRSLPDGTYYWSLQAIDGAFGGSEFAAEGSFVINTSGIVSGDDLPPAEFALKQNFPNPFNPQTVIRYALPRGTSVELTVYNILGEKVRTLVNQSQKAGSHRVTWDGRNDIGLSVTSGIYVYQLKADNFRRSMKMLLLR